LFNKERNIFRIPTNKDAVPVWIRTGQRNCLEVSKSYAYTKIFSTPCRKSKSKEQVFAVFINKVNLYKVLGYFVLNTEVLAHGAIRTSQLSPIIIHLAYFHEHGTDWFWHHYGQVWKSRLFPGSLLLHRRLSFLHNNIQWRS